MPNQLLTSHFILHTSRILRRLQQSAIRIVEVTETLPAASRQKERHIHRTGDKLSPHLDRMAVERVHIRDGKGQVPNAGHLRKAVVCESPCSRANVLQELQAKVLAGTFDEHTAGKHRGLAGNGIDPGSFERALEAPGQAYHFGIETKCSVHVRNNDVGVVESAGCHLNYCPGSDNVTLFRRAARSMLAGVATDGLNVMSASPSSLQILADRTPPSPFSTFAMALPRSA